MPYWSAIIKVEGIFKNASEISDNIHEYGLKIIYLFSTFLFALSYHTTIFY